MLKCHYSTVWSMKNVAVLTVDGAFPLFLRPLPGGFDTQESPPPGIYLSRQKEKKNAVENFVNSNFTLFCIGAGRL